MLGVHLPGSSQTGAGTNQAPLLSLCFSYFWAYSTLGSYLTGKMRTNLKNQPIFPLPKTSSLSASVSIHSTCLLTDELTQAGPVSHSPHVLSLMATQGLCSYDLRSFSRVVGQIPDRHRLRREWNMATWRQ